MRGHGRLAVDGDLEEGDHVAGGRGFDEATLLLDEDHSGTLVRDGWAVYRRYAAATHQTCVAHLLRHCKEMASDLPAGARTTPREVKEILLLALDARDLSATKRRVVAEDLAERIELLAEQAHPHDANRRFVSTSRTKPTPRSPSSPTPTSTPRTGGASRSSGRQSRTGRSGVATGPDEGRPPRAGS